MIEALKEQAAKFIFRKKIVQKEFEPRDFSTVFKRSFAFLILMPEDERDFRLSIPILEYLREQKKVIHPMTHDFRISLLPPFFKATAIEHGINDETKLKLPSKKLLDKIERTRFDVVMDMNREEVLFYSFIAKSINAPVKIGFARNDADNYFNLQIKNNGGEPEISYQNLLNCLRMF
jgi:hypothetical protein